MTWQPTIGSGIAAVPAIRAIRDHYGDDTELWLMVRALDPDASHPAELLREWVGLSGTLPMPQGRGLVRWLRFVRAVRRLRFDRAIYVDLSHPKQRTVRRLSFVSAIAGLGRPLGLPRPGSQAGPLGHEAAGRLANLAADGIPVPRLPTLPPPPPFSAHAMRAWLAGQRRPGHRLVALCPGARAAANLWPLDRFASLGERLLARGDCDIVVCGGPAERDSAQALIQGWGAGIMAAGTLSLSETAGLFAECDLVIGLDTGTSHLAAAAGAPLVVLQGARCLPGVWDPLGENVTVLRTDVSCAGCGQSRCPLPLHPCMRAIGIDAAWQAVCAALGEPSRP